MGATRKRTRSSSDSMPDPTSLGWASVRECPSKDFRNYGEVVRDWSSLEEWWQEVGEAELRLILWAAWDPIGRVPRDEYDWYVPRLWALLREHASLLREPAGYDELADAGQEEWGDRANASERKVAAQLNE